MWRRTSGETREPFAPFAPTKSTRASKRPMRPFHHITVPVTALGQESSVPALSALQHDLLAKSSCCKREVVYIYLLCARLYILTCRLPKLCRRRGRAARKDIWPCDLTIIDRSSRCRFRITSIGLVFFASASRCSKLY